MAGGSVSDYINVRETGDETQMIIKNVSDRHTFKYVEHEKSDRVDRRGQIRGPKETHDVPVKERYTV
ncbi:hypothetical protein [Halovenus amylolytica]|uniref:hypothetical protein n=1 Tax=Halovenus amylolytica TaxID=2500550 RepID=UPI003F571F9D